jgi:hypothetical protein
MTDPTLTAPGAVLRALQISDADALFAAHGDAQTHKYWAGPAHKDVAQTKRYIEETMEMRGAHVWAITEDGGEALGRIALFVLRDGVGEIGIIMRREATGRGFALSVTSRATGTTSIARHTYSNWRARASKQQARFVVCPNAFTASPSVTAFAVDWRKQSTAIARL